MTFLNVVIGYGIIASVMTTDIDLSKEVVGLHFVLWQATPSTMCWKTTRVIKSKGSKQSACSAAFRG
ncbi:hypothetical protein MJN12_18365 [Salmonella enterica subsp. enterica serovar Montevideo]|nr:hypothetical protein [Salmonella enterica subsp. enterica serovar Montevideo]